MSALRAPALSGDESSRDKNKDKSHEAKEIKQYEDSSTEEENQFGRLYKHLEAAKKRKADVWGLVDLINGFTMASAYKLSDKDENTLFEDMKAAADLLEAADNFHHAKDEQGNVSQDINDELEDKLANVLARAEADNAARYEKSRSIGIKIGIALSVVALGVAVGLLAAGAAPIVAAVCLVAGVILLAAAAIALYRQSNCTFFGQNQKNQMMLADLVKTESSALEPNTVRCCG